MSLYPTTHLHLSFWGVFLILFVFYLFRTAFFAGGAAWMTQSFSELFKRRIYPVTRDSLQISREVKAASIILIFDIFFSTLLIYFNIFKHTANSLTLFAFTFLLMFAWLEVWFYFTHRLFHHPKLFFIHAQHHVAKSTGPLTSLSFSVAERSFLLIGGIGVPVFLSYFLPLSFWGYVSYFTVNYMLTVFAHWNVEVVPPKLVQNPLGSFLNAPTYHSLHHDRYHGHFGLFTPYLDRLFKSSFSDYEILHENTYSGHGLKRPGQIV